MIQAWLFRGAVDLSRPSDICLYHLGCFQLALPIGQKAGQLAAVVLNSLQQGQQQHSIDQVLEAFRSAGAVLEIHVPKCKQNEQKRRHNGGHSIDWFDISKPRRCTHHWACSVPHAHSPFAWLQAGGQGG